MKYNAQYIEVHCLLYKVTVYKRVSYVFTIMFIWTQAYTQEFRMEEVHVVGAGMGCLGDGSARR